VMGTATHVPCVPLKYHDAKQWLSQCGAGGFGISS
jgi:hypothetical protein